MVDPELRREALSEMASIRSELAELAVHYNWTLGRVDVLRRYSARLELRLRSLERLLSAHEEAVLDRINARRCRSRSRSGTAAPARAEALATAVAAATMITLLRLKGE